MGLHTNCVIGSPWRLLEVQVRLGVIVRLEVAGTWLLEVIVRLGVAGTWLLEVIGGWE